VYLNSGCHSFVATYDVNTVCVTQNALIEALSKFENKGLADYVRILNEV
jgi:hypothetical protein